LGDDDGEGLLFFFASLGTDGNIDCVVDDEEEDVIGRLAPLSA
jgi:hypothetical protein